MARSGGTGSGDTAAGGDGPTTAVVLFTRDLRVHDNPTLTAGAAADHVVPLFVVDEAITGSAFARPNRAAFLVAALADLDAGLRRAGGRLVVRTGRTVDVVARLTAEVDAAAVHLSGDVSAYATARERALRRRLAEHGRELVVHGDTLFAVAPGSILPSGRGKTHMAVMGPYYRRWTDADLRSPTGPPSGLSLPDGIDPGRLPQPADIATGDTSPQLSVGGESDARSLLDSWTDGGLADYADTHDAMAADATSRLSAHLHFGTLSPTEVVARARRVQGAGPDAFVRQVAFRDFHAQVMHAKPSITHTDYRSRGDRWRTGKAADVEFAAWREGRTGFPLVDAGMRQLAAQGWMHNRARLITAFFLTKTLYLDWRRGAAHFADLLVDADMSNNVMNWQWVAGTGNDGRYNRTLSQSAQARKYDAAGDYVRQWVDELTGIEGTAVHTPWDLPGDVRAGLGYPDRIVDLAAAEQRFRDARGL